MKKLLSTIVPPEIIDSWIRGEYLIGTRRGTGYDFIGWALMLRGFYRYEVHKSAPNAEPSAAMQSEQPEILGPSDTLTHCGYCAVDLLEGDLFFSGLRLHTVPGVATEHALKPAPSLWVSLFSKFQEAPSTGSQETPDAPDLYFVHKTFKNRDSEPARKAAHRIRTTILSKYYAGVGGRVDDGSFQDDASLKGITHVEEPELRRLLQYLQQDFAADKEEIEAETQEGIRGLVRLDLSRREDRLAEPGSDMLIPGEYGAVGGVGLTGEARFYRLHLDL